ncbi:hypothetical protein [Limimaricola cinnabarinus]|jgi:hypothetical protein|uniref:Uncharacterized protein n=1 Tax=Limimaricola cinnabarinus LL-001 TaxID=1337093 RepID=U2Z7F8_9RHOB|nr:hypothetical protein [Limimaricola cinnabarinus]GAD56992.1 hypothetical protein MBELCI_3044 [Limimaricola cinnabarinus LL-001]
MTVFAGSLSRTRLVGVALGLAVIAVFAAANAHLIAVSFASQPDCVLSTNQEGAAFRAAKPAC